MRLRLMRAEFTSKKGFSVVAPMRMTMRSSTACSRASCWLREKRWISSMKRMVRLPLSSRRWLAASISLRRSLTLPVMALTSTKTALVLCAITCAMEVLPVPAGPYKITEDSASFSMARRSQVPLPTASSCPTTSFMVRGRMRTARGAALKRVSLSTSAKRLSMPSILMPPMIAQPCDTHVPREGRGRRSRSEYEDINNRMNSSVLEW